MNTFAKIMVILFSAGAIMLPALAAPRGWGLGGERNSAIIRAASEYCPPGVRRTSSGGCVRGLRSYYGGRSGRGGGYGFGK